MKNDNKARGQERSELLELGRRIDKLEEERQQLLKKFQEVNEQLVISSFKIKEQAQAATQERDELRAILNAMADEVWFVNADGIVTPVNEAAVRALGVERAAEVPKPVQELISKLEIYTPDYCPLPPEDAPLLRSLRGENITNFEEIVRLPTTGELRYRLVNSAPVRSADGRIVGAVAVGRDFADDLRRARKEVRILSKDSDLNGAAPKVCSARSEPPAGRRSGRG